MAGEVSSEKTVLVVEDEQALRRALCDKIELSGIRALEAENGNEGLTIALTKHPNLILLDLLMPEVSGMQMLEKLRADTWGKDVPVLILTNVSEQEKIADAVMENAYEYLIKSDWKLEDIVTKVKEKLAQK